MKRLLTALWLFLCCVTLRAQDSSRVSDRIDSAAVVVARKHTAPIQGNMLEGLEFDVREMDFFPKMLGNSDPMIYAQALPGITTNSELTNGLRVQGCEASQSQTSLCGIPVYGSGHILGLFSVFNPGHFQTMTVSTRSDSHKIGGELTLDTPDSIATRAHGDFNIGMVCAQGTVAFGLGRKSSMSVSARRSFIDLFYKGLLSFDNLELNYVFSDYNLSWIYKPDSKNTIDINGYYGADDGGTGTNSYGMGAGAKWGNGLGGVRWRYDDGKIRSTLQLYGTSYWCDADVDITYGSGNLKSDIVSGALTERLEWEKCTFGAELAYYNIQPQNICLETVQPVELNSIPRQSSVLGSVSADRRFYAGDWMFKPVLTLSAFGEIGNEKTWFAADPELMVAYDMHKGGTLNLDVGLKHQYLFQTGLTNSGFPFEFWLSCGQYSDPQYALSAALTYDVDLFNRLLTLSTQVYGKRLYNQVEYKGMFADVISGEYSIENELLHGDGVNYGVSLMLRKNSGKFTGWLSYTFGRALRWFDNPDYPDVYPSSYERLHELNAVASYKLGRWLFGGNFIFSGGLPYTPATSLYVIDNSVIVQYGDRNSKRLAPYIKLDLSVTFQIRRGSRFQDSVNFSVLNATAHQNQLLARLKLTRDGRYSYSPAIMVIPVIPSLSYQCRF